MSLFYWVNPTLAGCKYHEVAIWILDNMPFTDSSEEQCPKAACSYHASTQILVWGVVDRCFCFAISTANEDRW